MSNKQQNNEKYILESNVSDDRKSDEGNKIDLGSVRQDVDQTRIEDRNDEIDLEGNKGGSKGEYEKNKVVDMDGNDDEKDETLVFVPSIHGVGVEDVRTTDPEETWTLNHVKLLYLMSRYAVSSRAANFPESWIRQIPMFVLMFEGITAGILDFDYAPCSMLITWEGRSKRSWMNVTQEGKSAIDDLREKRMISGLKLSTEDFQPVTAYQVSVKGMAFVRVIPDNIKDEVNSFICAPHPYPQKLLRVAYNGTNFILHSGRYLKTSSITEAEDVSYVSSPFLPDCLRSKSIFRKEATSNRCRAHECSTGGDTIGDELDEAIVLGYVNCLVGEWIPFGSNQIVALNERLGALDRCQGGLFTSMVDKTPTDTKFEVPPGLTQVKILDYDFVRFINFEAEIHYPEESGVVQIENFGMHLNVDGTIAYGIKVEAIIHRQDDDISLDHLSRLLVDVHQDSSEIMNDLLSQYQRSLLDMIFMGDADRRNKYNMIIAKEVRPKLSAEDYMDKDSYENELKQVIGDLRYCFDIGPDDVLIIGRDGCLIAGPNIINYENIVVTYLGLLTRELFIRNFFVRTFVLDDSLKRLRKLIIGYKKDPNRVSKIRDMLNNASRDIILLREVLEYVKESLEDLTIPESPEDLSGRKLYKCLDLQTMKAEIMLRGVDLVKLMEGLHHQLETLQQMTEAINTQQLEDVFKNVDANTKYLVDASAAQERASASLEVMQIILAGSFAFDIVDRISGGTLNISVPNWVVTMLVDPIISVPLLWWFLNLLWLLLVSIALTKLMKYLAAKASGALTLRLKIDRKISGAKLKNMIAKKNVLVTDSIHEASTRLRKAAWIEDEPSRWGGACPTIEVLYDDRYEFLLSVFFQIDSKVTSFREEELIHAFTKMLIEQEVYQSKNK